MIAVLLEARMIADHRRELEAVELRHDDVDQHDGDVVAQQVIEGFPRRARGNEVLAQLLEDRTIGEQLRRLIVDEKDVDRLAASPCSSPILAMQPHPQGREQLLGIHRLRKVVRCPGLQAFLAVALHRLGGQRDDRQPPEVHFARMTCIV